MTIVNLNRVLGEFQLMSNLEFLMWISIINTDQFDH